MDQEPEDDSEEEENEVDPIAQAKLEIAQSKILKKEIRLKAGLEDDEIDTLLPTFEALKKFHAEMCHLKKHSSDDHLDAGDDGKEPAESEDSLSSEDIKRAQELEGVKRKKKKKMSPAAKAAFEAAGAHLPEEERGNSNDLQRLLDEIADDED